MKRLAQEELGFPFRFDALLNACSDRTQDPLDVQLSPEEMVQLDLADPERAKALQDFARRRNGPAAGNETRALYSCSSGAHAFAVDPYGWLRVCAISPGEGFELRSGSFQEGWDRFWRGCTCAKSTVT